MTDLRGVLRKHVDDGTLPGAVGLVARGDRIEVAAVGSADFEGTAPMARDTVFRIASTTKPITAAATMMLVDEGRVALTDPVSRWLPELASPVVVRTPASPVDDVVPAARPITVFDLLTFRSGYGFPQDFSLPTVQLTLGVTPALDPQLAMSPEEWTTALARVPLLHQPGEVWLYNTSSDILSVLIARVTGQSYPDFLAERIFEPLGMTDTGFGLPADKLDRFTTSYRATPDGALEQADAPDGLWSATPRFPSGAGGLVSTADDWLAFGRMLIADGVSPVDGSRLLSSDAVRKMTTDHLSRAQREEAHLFLEGQGWGFGGSVDVAKLDPWNVLGRYGWIGGTGTAAHVIPSTGTVTILLTQREMAGPTPPDFMRDFWNYAAAV